MEQLKHLIIKLRSFLNDDGDYSITRKDGKGMGFSEQMTLGKLFVDIDKALETDPKGERSDGN